jgi:hypothetical protein
MSLIVILNAFISISIISLLAGIAWFLHKILKLNEQEWVVSQLIRGALEDNNAKMAEMVSFFKVTFNKDFAAKIEDIVRIKENAPATVRRLCDDGEYHEVPIDKGW